MKPVTSKLTRHCKGTAVDLPKNTDGKMLKAIATVMRRLNEKSCVHFDDKGKTLPSRIDQSIKEKWPAV